MRIEDLRSETRGDRARVAATVVWEDCDQNPQELFYETTSEFADDLYCDPHAFLVACVVPAIYHGEERIAIDEVICPELRNGLLTAMGWLHHWYGSSYKFIHIDSKAGTRPWNSVTSRHSGSFLSGGVDSLAILRANHLDFPVNHPRSIKDCLIVHGFDIGGVKEVGDEVDTFEQAFTSLSAIVEDAKVTLIPVYTNVRHLEDSVDFWMHQFHGAALSSVAHIFSHRLAHISLASSFSISSQQPWGSHPLLDSNYGSADLQIRHAGLRFSRLEKVRLIADWNVALQNLRVCTMNPPGLLNCGKCEKCIRTMIELLALGKLKDTQAFPVNDLSVDLLESVEIESTYQDAWYRDLISPLMARERLDLVAVIEKKSEEFRKHLIWEEERDWKGAVKRFDRKWLGGALYKTYDMMRNGPSPHTAPRN